MKRAIYLDDRERDLARRLCVWVQFKCRESLHGKFETDVSAPALRWLDDEIKALRQKFEEPADGEGQP